MLLVRLPPLLIDRIDRHAENRSESRLEVVRSLLERGLEAAGAAKPPAKAASCERASQGRSQAF